MTPTSDERREVAARLRTEVGEDECIDYAVFRIINDALLINGAWGAKAARILADLIDPTCHNASPQAWGTFECSECGAQTWYQSIETRPRYCPDCGARVVSDDD